VITLCASGCGDNDSSPKLFANATGGQGNTTPPSTGGAPSNDSPCPKSASDLGTKDTNELFGMDKVPTFDLYLPATDWENLKAHAVDEQYVRAQACFEGNAVGSVGLRFKGSYGSLFTCFDKAGNDLGVCRKLGIKIKFDEYETSQRFYGIKRLNFQGYRWDDSYMKEHLSYEIYRAMGIEAPRSSWAQLRVNGDLQGLFGMVEEIDGRFTKDRWPDNGEGNLFKEVWPGDGDADWILSHLHTNTDAPDTSAMLAFFGAINAATAENVRATLASFTDLDYFTRYMVVDDAIANFDGVTTYYTSGGSPEGAGNHNFYFYQEATSRFTIIPWDLEATLDLASNFGNVPYWQTKPADCNATYPVWGGENSVIAPGCNPVFQALAADVSAYRTYAQQLLDGPFAEARMSSNIDAAASFIREAAHADPHGPGATKFENGVGFIKQNIPKLRQRLMHFMSGQSSTPLVFETGKVADFESADNYGITDGTGQMSNAHSTGSVQLNTAEPISGTKSLRITFSFGNEAEPWNQWLWYRVPMFPSPTDVRALMGIKIKTRSSIARTLRLSLISPHNSKTTEGIDVGWDLPTTTSATEHTVKFANAAVQSWVTADRDPHDDLQKILQTITNLSFQPSCVIPNSSTAPGQLPDGYTDDGWIDIDDITFF
jgi:hypothetical protein